MDKGEDAFVKEMMKESIKGINVLSKPAVVVQFVLQNYLADWMKKNVEEYQELLKRVDAKKVEMSKTGKNDKCPDLTEK